MIETLKVILLPAAIIIAVAAIIYAYRYEYVLKDARGYGLTVLRINRLTGEVCYLRERGVGSNVLELAVGFPECD